MIDRCSAAWPAVSLLVMGALLGSAAPIVRADDFPADIRVTQIDSGVTHYATFQSHNQKVVANEHGIFVTHIRDRDLPYQAQTWRLSRSTDGGANFSTLCEQTDATNPPVIETDAAGNLHVIRVDFVVGDAWWYRFDAAQQFRDPQVARIPGAAAGKYAMAIDGPRQQLYFFAHNGAFRRIGLDGKVDLAMTLLKSGDHAALQYPLLALDDAGNLHAAWTTVKHGEYLYWDIHHMLSPDGGTRWQDLAGRPIAIPAIADDQGPAERISAADEYQVHTWLSSMLAVGGKLHFAYLAQSDPPRQHYVRYDLASGERDRHVQPEFRGERISVRGLSGYFVADAERPRTVYYVSQDAGRIAVLRSEDNGDSWHDYARSEERYALYAIGGFRRTHEGAILGTFTDQRSSADVLDFRSDVHAFQIHPRPAN